MTRYVIFQQQDQMILKMHESYWSTMDHRLKQLFMEDLQSCYGNLEFKIHTDDEKPDEHDG